MSKEGESSKRGIEDVRRPSHEMSGRFRGSLLSSDGWRYTVIGVVSGILVAFGTTLLPGISLAAAIILGILVIIAGPALQLDARSQDLDARTQAAIRVMLLCSLTCKGMCPDEKL